MSDRPLCFVLMPFGIKKDPAGGPDIDFDRIYKGAIGPAIEAAGMKPIRADKEPTGGIIHRAMFERLLLCDYAVADLTTANANVFYELGVRHAAKPATTLAIFSRHQTPPFDVAYLRALPYALGKKNRFGDEETAALKSALTARLEELREVAIKQGAPDSPIFQLLKDEYTAPVQHLKTDAFLDRVRESEALMDELADARESRSVAGLEDVERKLGAMDGAEVGVLIDLFLSYRALSQWKKMIELYARFPETVRRAVMVREQYALALNRDGQRSKAVRELNRLIEEQGPSSETNGILGRVHKDLFLEAFRAGDEAAAGHLDNALDAYRRGFEADWRDAYPGINALTLLDIKGTEASLAEKVELTPVVRYAVVRRLKSGAPDYWDYATMVELEVLDNEEESARRYLQKALAAIRATWEPETTVNNLTLIRDARRKRGVEQPWVDDVIAQLQMRAA